MNKLIKELLDLLTKSHSAHKQNPSDIGIVITGLRASEAAFSKIAKYLEDHPFSDALEEENYYRNVLPRFIAIYHYYLKVYKTLEIYRDYGKDVYSSHLSMQLESVSNLLKVHLEFLQSSAAEMTDPGVLWRVMQAGGPSRAPSSASRLIEDEILSLNASPYVKMTVDYKYFLQTQKSMLAAEDSGDERYEFIGTKADAMELIQGLTLKKVIRVNGVDATLAQNAKLLTKVWNMTITNIYNTKRVNEQRKKEKTPFLTSMSEEIVASAQNVRGRRK